MRSSIFSGTNARVPEQLINRDRGESRLSSPPTPPDKRVRIRRFDELIPCRTGQRPEVRKNAPPMVVSPLVEFHCRLHPLPTRSSSARGLIGWRMATHETRFPTDSFPSFRPSSLAELLCPLLTSAARSEMDYSTLSPGSGTCSRSPAISLTAFNAQPPNLPPAPLMDVDFAVIGQLVRRRRPHIRFLSIGSRLCSTLPSDPASRRRPCASLSLLLHQDVKGTYTPKLSNMHGVQRKSRQLSLTA